MESVREEGCAKLQKAIKGWKITHHVRDPSKDSNMGRKSRSVGGKNRKHGRISASFDDYEADHSRDSYTGVNGNIVANRELDNNYRSDIQYERNLYGTYGQRQTTK